jgi:hypothetical protein
MKFNKQTPKRSGIYWYVDTSYPIPKVCWFDVGVGNQPDAMYDLCGGATVMRPVHYEHYRWGDEIIPPECAENEIEY